MPPGRYRRRRKRRGGAGAAHSAGTSPPWVVWTRATPWSQSYLPVGFGAGSMSLIMGSPSTYLMDHLRSSTRTSAWCICCPPLHMHRLIATTTACLRPKLVHRTPPRLPHDRPPFQHVEQGRKTACRTIVRASSVSMAPPNLLHRWVRTVRCRGTAPDAC